MRSDGSPVYNLTNVIDDNYMQISHVIRGEDHIKYNKTVINLQGIKLKSTPIAHLPMILGEDRKD